MIGGLTKDINNLEVAKKLLKIFNLNNTYLDFVKDRPGHDRKYAVDWSKIKNELGWEPDSVDALIFVSQTPDYLLPATSCTLHRRLGLSKHCMAFDIILGCSGYVYGLFVACRLVAGVGVRRLLLLVGDTITRIVSPQDRSSAMLFGDAGTATAIERNESAGEMLFELGTDGSGQNELIVPAGGFR